jgi:hypothetical protein
MVLGTNVDVVSQSEVVPVSIRQFLKWVGKPIPITQDKETI